MIYHSALVLLLLATFSVVTVTGSYLCFVPASFHPGWELTVAVTVTESKTTDPISIQATLITSRSDIAVATGTGQLNKGETTMVPVQVPDAVSTTEMYKIKVEGSGGLSFTKTVPIEVNYNRSVVLVQTDKKIYKPGQTIKFRVLNVDLSLKPVIHPLTVIIKNAKGSKLERFSGLTSRGGVVEETFLLPKYPSLGTWSIDVLDESEKLLHTNRFSVEEFVPPKFSVDVEASPDYLIRTDKSIRPAITVKSVYTYGKGVQGSCKLTIRNADSNEILTSVQKEMIEGQVEFTNIDWSSIMNSVEEMRRTVILAEVTDPTERTEAGEITISSYLHDVDLQILPKSNFVVRNKMKAKIYIKVSDHTGNPLKSAVLNIELDLPSHDSIRTKVTVPEGQTEVVYSFTPLRKQKLEEYFRPGSIRVILESNKKVVAHENIQWYGSNEGSVYIQKPASETLRQPTDFVVENQVSSVVYYLIFAQGKIVEAAKVPDSGKVTITPSMTYCPEGKLMVYSVIPKKDQDFVVADEVSIAPSVCFAKQTTVSFDAMKTRTGSDVNMNIRVDRLDGSNEMPGVHEVFYLGVDKSIVLMQGGTDLSAKRVLAGLAAFESSPDINASENPPVSAENIMRAVGLTALTNAILKMYNTQIYYKGRAAQEDFADNFMFYSDAEMVAVQKSDTKAGPGKTEESPSKVRKDFPDTWLWGTASTQLNGKVSQSVRLPDTITSWLVSAFAINTKDGLAVANKPFELTAFKTFFLTMSLPYSIKRGEVFSLRITVFNYRDMEVNVNVRLELTDKFSVIKGMIKSGWVEEETKIRPNMASSVVFQINATTLGLMDLHAVATDIKDKQEDEVIRKLLVKPEGVENPEAITKVMRLASTGSMAEKFMINWPYDKIVPDSQRLEVKITGEILGQALKGLDSLVTQPFGCGEQNMITTVPNIFGLMYIEATNAQGVESLKTDMTRNMKLGYQRQVDQYRHEDGSFSAWGPRDTSGSTWLTAFVIKSFAQASKFISVDPEVLTSGIDFLKNKQTSDGQFVEDGRVLHSEMQAGSGSGFSLTVYVLISMLESAKALGVNTADVSQQSAKALTFVENNIDKYMNSDPPNKFLLAMTAYAYALATKPATEAQYKPMIKKLMDAISEGGTFPESSTSSPKVAADQIGGRFTYRPPQVKPGKLEIAAYMLLVYSQQKDLSAGFELMKWLQAQQNSKGGFRSTQDTVMVLQALSSFGMVYSAEPSQAMLTVTVPSTGQSTKVDISGKKAILVQTVDVSNPSQVDEVIVNMTGVANNFAVVKVVYTFYTLAGDIAESGNSGSTVTLITRTNVVSETVHEVKACVESSRNSESGMYVASMSLPSGESAMDDINTMMADNPKASKIETDEDSIHFYMNDVPTSGLCLRAKVERLIDFEVQKPGSAKFYSYYEPEFAEEVPLVLTKGQSTCNANKCESDGAVTLNLTSLLLTAIICTIISLLSCM